ncbi:hypothetical protein BGW80DRAFT_1254089 [Lactifluus volemus]|nr:hypothetical protein BGW80DRAFT_1254089 [Lactifluus volemus]
MAECLNVLLKEFDHAQLGEETRYQGSKRFLTQFAEWAPQAVLKRRNKNAEDVMDANEEDDDSDEVDSIMDEDEPESSRTEDGGDDRSGHQVDGERTQQTSKKSGSKSELAMAALTDDQAALAAQESNQLLYLHLRKWHYAGALNFIRQVEEAAQMIFQLLGSTHKAESGIKKNVTPDLAEGQQLDVRRWEGARGRSLASAARTVAIVLSISVGLFGLAYFALTTLSCFCLNFPYRTLMSSICWYIWHTLLSFEAFFRRFLLKRLHNWLVPYNLGDVRTLKERKLTEWLDISEDALSKHGKRLKDGFLKSVVQGALDAPVGVLNALTWIFELPGLADKRKVQNIFISAIASTLFYEAVRRLQLDSTRKASVPMMRYMTDNDQILSDVVTKLWQVYSSERQLPKQQRRGAMIIIGMLALARRSVVQGRCPPKDWPRSGGQGRFDPCQVALQRLNGSAKKVKGSLLDKSIRLNMDSLVFLKLQEAIEHLCRSREWFALAEQAIHIVYALGDQLERSAPEKPEPSAAEEQVSSAVPDADAMDKDLPPSAQALISTVPGSTQGALTGNAAKKSDDTGDAFEVSQLLFVVGHVAVKHIVYLELVEREWKRQKQEKELAEKLARGTGNDGASKDEEELDQVAGNAEYEIGDRSNATLRAVATLSFSRFLCVSSQICDANHPLLFPILETSRDPNIRSNIAIALGDVAVSFSTIVLENSDELFDLIKLRTELNEFESALEESRRQGAEDQAFEKRVEGKKAVAKKRATRQKSVLIHPDFRLP